MKFKPGLLFLMLLGMICMGCGQQKATIDNIPDAENMLFTPDGRLFVTGGKNIYLINSSAEGYTPVPLYDAANFTGMAQYGDYLYALCSKIELGLIPESCDGLNLISATGLEDMTNCLKNLFMEQLLLRAQINDSNGNPIAQPQFEAIYTFEDMLIPNGMVADNQGRLYISDETFLPQGKIVRLTITGDESDPQVNYEEWLGVEDGVYSPNGLAIKGNIIYFTDLDATNLFNMKAQVKRVDINHPETITTLLERPGGLMAPFSIFDDLTVVEGYGQQGVLVADFNLGSVLLVIDDGTLKSVPDYEKDLNLAHPSSVAIGQGPDFTSNDLLITEKGMMVIDPYSDYGNKIKIFEIQ